jgi:hypothetical protein
MGREWGGNGAVANFFKIRQHNHHSFKRTDKIMNLRQLRALISQGESETLEFKTSTAQLKPACEALCGFLNAKGGTGPKILGLK